jgi:hypothetical protein
VGKVLATTTTATTTPPPLAKVVKISSYIQIFAYLQILHVA